MVSVQWNWSDLVAAHADFGLEGVVRGRGVNTGNQIESHPNDQQSDETMSMPEGEL